MSSYSLLDAARVFGIRGPLLNSNNTFVGREREILSASASLTGPQITSLWLWGPRRIGKTSLSHQIKVNKGLKLIRFSCDKLVWKGIETFLLSLADSANSQLASVRFERKLFLEEMERVTSPDDRIVLILDDFDKFAVNLQQYEQALLRSALTRAPYFGIIFISRNKPTDLLQDYSDESSRLLGVCDMIRLPMLSFADVKKLVRIAGDISGTVFPDWFPLWMYDRVGGHPICVQTLLKESLIAADTIKAVPNEHQLSTEEHGLFGKVENDLRRLWSDFPFDVRCVLLDQASTVGDHLKREIRALGLFGSNGFIRPAWLLEIGKTIGLEKERRSLPELFGLIKALNDSLMMCNEICLRCGKSAVFQVTQQFFKFFELARSVGDEVDLNNRIGILHKICVESTNSEKISGTDKCLIPKDIRARYKKSEGFQVLTAWRNFSFHDPSTDLEPGEKSERYTNMGEICCRYLGQGRYMHRNTRELNRIYEGILGDVIDSVMTLRAALENPPC